MLSFNVKWKLLQYNSHLNRYSMTLCRYSVFSLCVFYWGALPASGEEFFNPSFLSDSPAEIADLSRFNNNEGQPPGHYRVDIYVNDEYAISGSILFQMMNSRDSSEVQDDTGLQACLTANLLEKIGVNLQSFISLTEKNQEQCVDLSSVIPMAGSKFDFDKLRLMISIPQVAIKNNIRGYIPPEEWDEGIPALLLNYDFTGSHIKNDSLSRWEDNYYLNVNSGLNFDAWRLRNYSVWNYGRGNGARVNKLSNISTYVQRAVKSLNSSLTMGDSYTLSEIFPANGFRGIQLATDDNMLPDSLRGYAPTVRGIANSNARVTVKQNGYVIYQQYVTPGAFEINDLYPTSSSGNLQVTVTELNGVENSYTVPYSAVPVLQRDGHRKYTLVAGQYRGNNEFQDKPVFSQGTLYWGLPFGMTLYGGAQFANDYRAFALGSGFNLGQWGAVSTDIIQADSILADGSHHQGQSVRVLYAKSLSELGTNVQLVGYRYSTRGFYTLDEMSYKKMSGYTDDKKNGSFNVGSGYQDYYNLNFTKKSHLQLNVTQQLGNASSIFINGSKQTYWRTSRTNELWQLGYNSMHNKITYSLTYSYNKNRGFNDTEQRFAINLSVPLSQWLFNGGKSADITNSNNTAYATYAANSDNHGNINQQAGISGNLLPGNNLSYNVMQGHGNHNAGYNGYVNLAYQGGYGNGNLGYSYSKNYKQVNYGMSGGVVAHADGVTLSQPLGDTNVLIKAPGASDVSLENTTGVNTDWRGYAVVPYATSYRVNRMALNTTTLRDNADVDNAVVNVVPTQGALVRAEFSTQIGARVLLTLRTLNGKPVPFGATVEQPDNKRISIVNDNSQVYLAGMPARGILNIQWGNTVNERCQVNYRLPQLSVNKAINYATAECK